jgi:La-related protein 7
MSSADAPGDLPAVGALTVRDAGGEKGKGKGAPPEPEASAADGDETSGKQSEGSDAAPTAAKPSLKPLTDEQRAKITTQVEFYFSDANLPTDAFLLKKVKADPEGWVPIGVVCGFNRMKQLLKKHPPVATVAAIVAERSRVLVVDETLGKIRRAEPLPDFDLEDIQARTVVAENLGAEPTVEGVAKAFALDVVAEDASTNDDVQKTNDVPNENVPNAAIKNTNATRSVPPSMVRVRHPGMQTPAGVCAATTGLDLVRVASGATHALIEYETRELAELAVRLKNDDKDWRHGLRVRLLVKNVKAAAKKKKQREERAQRDEGEEAEAEAEADTEKTDKEKTSETSAETGPETAPVSASKKKGKHKKGKRDYSQWASAAAFKENKQTFLTEGEDGGVGAAGDAAADGAAPGAESVAPSVSSAPPRAPTMPDGTRGFAFGAATGKPRRAFPPGVPTEPKKTEAAEAERLAPETAEETRSSE